MLKNKGLKGRKFRRQHSIENYIVDFFSYEESLVIEIDGSSHDGLVAGIYDEIRQKRLEELGFKVLRFDAKDILHDLDRVIETIGQNFTK